MNDKLDTIEKQLGVGRNFDSPPLHLWCPDFSGDIPIVIASDGTWFHEGDPILRESLVRLFASILRREKDGEYYLVTPTEKWRLEVEMHPLVVTDVEMDGDLLSLTLNTGRKLQAGDGHPLFLEPRLDDVAAVHLWHGLTAIFSRNAWYRLVDLADEHGTLHSGAYHFSLT